MSAAGPQLKEIILALAVATLVIVAGGVVIVRRLLRRKLSAR